MKLHSDDPRFTAWLLGELPPAEAEEMSRLVAGDPASQVATRQAQEFHEQLSELFGTSAEQLHPLQREKILRAARQSEPANVVALPQSSTRSFAGWWIATAAAAAVVIGIWFQDRSSASGNATVANIAREISLLPVDAGNIPRSDDPSTGVSQPGGGNQAANAVISVPANGDSPDTYLQTIARDLAAAPLPRAADLPEIAPRGFLQAAIHPQVPLPLQAGSSAWKWITQSIIEEKSLPSARMIRIEEMVNAFPAPELPRLHATAAASPTHSDRQWIFVTVNNSQSTAKPASLIYRPAAVSRYRLVGFGSQRSLDLGASRQIPANTQTTLMLEVTNATATDLGRLELTIDGASQILPLHSETPDTRHRHLACIAAFGMKLGGDALNRSALESELTSLEAIATSPSVTSSLAVVRQGLSMMP
jgi:hypothetical protein